MVRGCEVRVVRLKDHDSRFFEEVLFILRDGGTATARERDVVAEANRILNQCRALPHGGRRRARGQSMLLPFLSGAAVAAAVLLPLLLLI